MLHLLQPSLRRTTGYFVLATGLEVAGVVALGIGEEDAEVVAGDGLGTADVE